MARSHRSPAIRLLLALACAAVLTAGCGGPATDSGGQSSGGGSSPGAIASASDLAAALKRDHSDADWYADITDITQTTMLGAPVVAIHTSWKLVGETDPAVFENVNAKRPAIGQVLDQYEIAGPLNIVFQDADGTVTLITGTGTPLSEAYDLPPAPTTAADLKAWLAQVYGPGGIVKLGPDEDWYGLITSIQPGGADSGGGTVVKTSVPTMADVRFSLIMLAVGSSGTPLHEKGIWFQAADGTGASARGSGGGQLFY